MISYSDNLAKLLPSIYLNYPYASEDKASAADALLKTIAEQIKAIESDIDKLYDNWFIETCSEWVVPYLADMIGVTQINPVVEKDHSSRAWVANAIGYRRRKGTLWILEQLARDVTNFDSTVVEFFQYLATTQHINHKRIEKSLTCDTRKVGAMEVLGTPFDKVSRNLDVREIQTGSGRYNIPNIGFFLWRIQPYPIYDAPAQDLGNGRFTFSQLGHEKMQLFNLPVSESSISQATSEINLPAPITRRALIENKSMYYDKNGGRSISITVDEIDKDVNDIVVCNLQNWDQRLSENKVALDPVLGRLAFPEGVKPQKVLVSYCYGFSGDIGSGPFLKSSTTSSSTSSSSSNVYLISKTIKEDGQNRATSVGQALTHWASNSSNAPNATVIFEIEDNEIYEEESLTLHLKDKTSMIIRAGGKSRPVIKLPASAIEISCEPDAQDSNVVLEGLMIAAKDNNIIKVPKGNVRSLTVRQCTLVPEESSVGTVPGSSIFVEENDQLLIRFERSISGRISMTDSRAALECVETIVDGKGDKPAISCYKIKLDNCTVFGRTDVTAIDCVSNTIFTESVLSQRRQIGCIRFSFVPPSSQVPRCYKCLPNFLPSSGGRAAAGQGTAGSAMTKRPFFVSTRYGDPGYAQLSMMTDLAIFSGADNGNEIGVFNYLRLMDRLSNLRMALDEYMRFGMAAGVFFAT